jgi:hypothetical protein
MNENGSVKAWTLFKLIPLIAGGKVWEIIKEKLQKWQ